MSICYVMLCQGGTSCVNIDKTSIVRLLLVLIFCEGGGGAEMRWGGLTFCPVLFWVGGKGNSKDSGKYCFCF